MMGANMPSSGSLSVQYLTNLLFSYLDSPENAALDVSDVGSVDAVHSMITANNIAFSDRNQYMADSDFVDVPVDGLSDIEYIKNRTTHFDALRAVATPIPFGIPPGVDGSHESNDSSLPLIEHGTSHFFVVDAHNNVATVTTTIEGV